MCEERVSAQQRVHQVFQADIYCLVTVAEAKKRKEKEEKKKRKKEKKEKRSQEKKAKKQQVIDNYWRCVVV